MTHAHGLVVDVQAEADAAVQRLLRLARGVHGHRLTRLQGAGLVVQAGSQHAVPDGLQPEGQRMGREDE